MDSLPNKRLKTGEAAYVSIGGKDSVSTTSTAGGSHSPDDSIVEPATAADSLTSATDSATIKEEMESNQSMAPPDPMMIDGGDEIELLAEDDDDDDDDDDDEKSISISVSMAHSVAGAASVVEGADEESSVIGASNAPGTLLTLILQFNLHFLNVSACFQTHWLERDVSQLQPAPLAMTLASNTPAPLSLGLIPVPQALR
jgi:hypothetical protein